MIIRQSTLKRSYRASAARPITTGSSRSRTIPCINHFTSAAEESTKSAVKPSYYRLFVKGLK